MLKKWTRPPLGMVIAEVLRPDEVRLIGASVGELLLLEPPQATTANEMKTSKANRILSLLAPPHVGRAHCLSMGPDPSRIVPRRPQSHGDALLCRDAAQSCTTVRQRVAPGSAEAAGRFAERGAGAYGGPE